MVMLYFLHMTNVEERCERQLFGQLVDESKAVKLRQKRLLAKLQKYIDSFLLKQ